MRQIVDDASIDLLSGGRIRLAVGVGWNAAEYEGLGADFKNRTALLDEQIDVMRMLWTQDLVDFEGRFAQHLPTVIDAKHEIDKLVG